MILAAVVLLITDGILDQQPQTIVALTPLLALQLLCLFLLQRGLLWPARFLIPVGIYAVVSYLVTMGSGTHDPGVIAYVTVIIASGLTLGRNATLIFGVLSTVPVLVIGTLEINGVLENDASYLTDWNYVTLQSILLLVASVFQWLLMGRLNESLRQARENERAEQQASQQLRELQVVLESRVEERTQALEHRTRYLEATSEVMREVTATLDMQALFAKVVNLISRQFGFYHTGIFLMDETGDWVQLQAASSEGGRQMLSRGHRLRVTDEGIVGFAANRGEARVALDIGDDPFFLHNPDLPDTRSEIALPLQARGEIIGALDVQSVEPEAFTSEDVTVLQTLADQVAVAVDNARLFAETQEALEAARRAYGELSQEAWQELLRTRAELGARYDPQSILPPGGRQREGVKLALRERKPIADAEGQLNTLAIPLEVRGRVIGVIDAYKPDDDGEWTQEEIDLMATLTAQLSQALESARLYEDTQRRAARERVTREIVDQIRGALTVDEAVQRAIQQLGDVLEAEMLARLMVQTGASKGGQE
ncbi:MAG: GAF domain-containing protein [Chloroflexi bacterium]|nr:GAF domain-containing protein [Chloroflexota bacterium]